MSNKQLRADLQTALQNLATGDLRTSATALLGKLGYLLHLKDKPGADARIDWNAIRPQQVRAVNHDQLAGLQMADAVASSLFFAVNLTQYSEVEDRYFRMLRPTIYRHPKTGELGYGLKFWPGSLEALTESMGHLVSFSPPK